MELQPNTSSAPNLHVLYVDCKPQSDLALIYLQNGRSLDMEDYPAYFD